MSRILRGLLFVAACFFSAGPALAQPTEPPADGADGGADSAAKAEAAALLEEGKQLYDEGKYEAACQKFEASVAKKSAIGNRFQLANCYEKIGRTASAHALFLEVADATHALGQLEREKLARERAAALEPLPAEVPPPTRAPPVAAVVAPVAQASPVPEQPPQQEKQPLVTRRGVATALLGVGTLGLLTGGAMTALAVASNNDADKLCAGGACSPGEYEQRTTLEDNAKQARTWAFVGFGAGAAAVGCAAFLFLTGSERSATPESRSHSRSSVAFRAVVGPTPEGFAGAVAGTF